MRFKKTMIFGIILSFGILECDARFRSRCRYHSHSHHSSVRAKNATTAKARTATSHAEPHQSSSSVMPFIYGAIAGHALTTATQSPAQSEAKTLEQAAVQTTANPTTTPTQNDDEESCWPWLLLIFGLGATWWILCRRDDY